MLAGFFNMVSYTCSRRKGLKYTTVGRGSKGAGIKMALTATLNRILFRRPSAFLVTVVVGAIFFERAFDYSADALWDRINDGVSP